MKNNVMTVMKKELARMFGDRRLVVSSIIMPGILLFVLYSFMGNFMLDMFTVDDDYVYEIHVVNMPASIGEITAHPDLNLNIIHVSPADIERIKDDISNQRTDLLIVFPPNFDRDVMLFDPLTATAPAPNIEIWSNTARTESAEARMILTSILENYHFALTHRFSINAPTAAAPYGIFDLVTDADLFAMVIGMLVPMMFLVFIYSGCQAIAPESIAGEKERGTLGSMLVTPTRRRDMALGKILSIAIFGLLSALGSMIGMLFSLPNLMYGVEGNVFQFYDVIDFVMLIAIAASTTLVFVGILSIMSAIAKSVKEANSYAAPIMILCFVAGLASMFLGGSPEAMHFYLIPILNSSLSIAAVFAFEANGINVLVTVLSNLAFTLITTIALARVFSSEKIVFDK
ncbi:MAG: ABC transporter permease subunit [Defluviitaleaceae bacterium]|nr:ABC transporter permease subunit [Defluviitaleaceae bacterium]